MIKQGDYGVVRVLRGAYRRQIGYYDNDEDGKAVLYLGAPTEIDVQCVLIGYGSLVAATQEEKIAFEMEHLASIPPELRDRMGIHP